MYTALSWVEGKQAVAKDVRNVSSDRHCDHSKGDSVQNVASFGVLFKLCCRTCSQGTLMN